MSNEVNVNISGTEDVSDALGNVADASRRTENVVVSSMSSTEQALDSAAQSTGTLGDRMDKMVMPLMGVADGFDNLTGSVDALIEFQNKGAEMASELEQRQLDVGQAMQDTRQATRDLAQAQIDLNQSQVDSKQAAADAVQAQIDAKQALVDASTAQKDYNKAVEEHGPASDEATQAAIDLEQAQADLNQANIDAEQSQIDVAQAQEDAAQAAEDAAQAGQDAAQSQHDLNDAQRAAKPPTELQEWGRTLEGVAPLAMVAVGGAQLLTGAISLMTGSVIANAAAWVGARIATMAGAVATGVMTAAQWALNAAMTANPIGLVVLAVMALIAVIVVIATKTTWFQDIWNAVWGGIVKTAQWTGQAIANAFKGAIDFVLWYFNFVYSIPGHIANFFVNVGSYIIAPFKTAFNWIARAWNNTVGQLRFSIPDWVPGLGGAWFAMPRLPTLQRGGEITRTGAVLAHKGERILPASTRGLWNDNGSGGTSVVELRLTGGPEEFRRWMRKNTRVYGGGGPNGSQKAWGVRTTT